VEAQTGGGTMNRKQFLGLLIAVLVLGAATLFTMKREQTSWQDASGRVGQTLLDFDVNNVAAAKFTSSAGSATLANKGGAWRVQERKDYPADFKAFSEFLVKLREMKILQVEALAVEQRARLELTPPGKDSKSGTLVELSDKAAKPLAVLLLGKEFMRGGAAGTPSYPIGRFVITGKDVPALQAAQSVVVVGDTLSAASGKPESWLQKDFFKVERIKSIAVKGEDAAHSWTIARAKPDDFWKLEGAASSDDFDPVNGNQAAGALEAMLMQDVVLGAGDDVTGLAAPIVVTAQTFDNLNYTMRIGKKKDDQRYLRVALTGEAPKQRTPAANEKPEDKDKLDKAFKNESAKLEARLKQERGLSDWTYLVPGWKLESMLRARAQLKADKNKPPASAMQPRPGLPLPGQ
jgi:hypothetical protein